MEQGGQIGNALRPQSKTLPIELNAMIEVNIKFTESPRGVETMLTGVSTDYTPKEADVADHICNLIKFADVPGLVTEKPEIDISIRKDK